MFAKVLSISDVLMWRWYMLLSFKSEVAIAALKAEVEGGRNPKDAKVALAMEITARFHSAADADRAEQDFINRSKGGVPDEIAELTLPLGEGGAPVGIGALLKMAGLAASSGEGNRLIDGGGVGWFMGGERQGIEAGVRDVCGAGGQAQVCPRYFWRKSPDHDGHAFANACHHPDTSVGLGGSYHRDHHA